MSDLPGHAPLTLTAVITLPGLTRVNLGCLTNSDGVDAFDSALTAIKVTNTLYCKHRPERLGTRRPGRPAGKRPGLDMSDPARVVPVAAGLIRQQVTETVGSLPWHGRPGNTHRVASGFESSDRELRPDVPASAEYLDEHQRRRVLRPPARGSLVFAVDDVVPR